MGLPCMTSCVWRMRPIRRGFQGSEPGTDLIEKSNLLLNRFIYEYMKSSTKIATLFFQEVDRSIQKIYIYRLACIKISTVAVLDPRSSSNLWHKC